VDCLYVVKERKWRYHISHVRKPNLDCHCTKLGRGPMVSLSQGLLYERSFYRCRQPFCIIRF